MTIYTVYNNRTDEPVAFYATAQECADAMGIKVNSFYAAIGRTRDGRNKKWSIEKVEEEDDDES